MRMVGQVGDAAAAGRFAAFLRTQGVDCDVRAHGSGWAVWVYDEDAVPGAAREFQAFRERPDDPRFAVPVPAVAPAEAMPITHAAERAATPPTSVAVPWLSRLVCPCSGVLIGLSVLCALLTRLGDDPRLLRYLLLTSAAFSRGELWRLVTPIFLHFGVLHLLFNMLWLRQLGSMVETARGRGTFLAVVLVVAVVSNLAQYLAAGAAFGGMSGVVYGLLGYIWMKSRRDPWSGLHLEPLTIYLMLAWLILGTLGLAGPLANWAHGAGLAVGLLLALPRRRLFGR